VDQRLGKELPKDGRLPTPDIEVSDVGEDDPGELVAVRVMTSRHLVELLEHAAGQVYEEVFLVFEVEVEGCPRYACLSNDIVDLHISVAGAGNEDPGSLYDRFLGAAFVRDWPATAGDHRPALAGWLRSDAHD